MLFITEYQVIGSRCSGTYLTNAPSKKDANKIIKAYDPDYTRVRSLTKAEWLKLNGEEFWEIMVGDAVIPQEGESTHLESGT